MDVGFILLGFLGLAVVLAFMHVLSKMANEREDTGRPKEKRSKGKRIVPLTDDTITHLGHS